MMMILTSMKTLLSGNVVETNRIIIISHPEADRSISAKGLRDYTAYSRRYRNRRIGEFLKELHLTEGRNTGFRKIWNALRLNGSPEPLFETDEERTYFATTLYIHPEFLDQQARVYDRVFDLLNACCGMLPRVGRYVQQIASCG